jgi:hypothetical protein
VIESPGLRPLLPHIFIAHAGQHQYFLDAVASAARHGCVHVLDLAALGNDSEQFQRCRASYVHLSGKSVTYELEWCIRRFFMLRDCLKAHGIERSWMIDSDVLVVGALPDPAQFPSGTYCGISLQLDGDPIEHHASPHCSFWTLEAAESFCSFVTDLYDRGASEMVDVARERERRGIRGQVGDMRLLYLWARGNPRVLDLHDFLASGLIDHNLRQLEQPRGVRLQGISGNKALTVSPDGVFVRTLSGKKIRVCSLHFQGKAKILMGDFLHGRTARYAMKAGVRHSYGRFRLALRGLKNRFGAKPQ